MMKKNSKTRFYFPFAQELKLFINKNFLSYKQIKILLIFSRILIIKILNIFNII